MTHSPPDFSSADAETRIAEEARRRRDQNISALAPSGNLEVTDVLIGHRVGHFAILARLGSGAMAAVYRARDQILDRDVALKVLLPGADGVIQERFRQEARTVSVLEHPNIVHTLQVGQADGVTYIAMELVEGTSLAELLGEQGKLSVAESCRLLEPIARALAYAHRQHIVHRDVKPSNILMRRVESATAPGIRLAHLTFAVTPLLTDFGIALALDSPELTAAGRTVGTPTYMAPEQASGSHEIDGRADIYALGIVLYRCLVGRPPFVGTTTQILHAHVYEPLTIPEAVLSTVPPIVLEVLQRALAKNPDDRYLTADALAADLARIGGSEAASSSHDDMDRTATMAVLSVSPPPASPERFHVLIPVPPSPPAHTYSSTNRPGTPTQGGERVPRVAASSHIKSRRIRPKRGLKARFGLVVGTSLALLLIIAGVLALRTVLPDSTVDQLLAEDPSAALTVATAPALAIVPTAIDEATEVAVVTPGIDDLSTVISGTTGVAPAEAASTPQPAPTVSPTVAPAATVDVDVELFWDLAKDDFQNRQWNQTLGSLILILRTDEAFVRALASDEASQAQLVLDLLLNQPEAPIWQRWQELFGAEQIEEMLFHSYVGLATEENARGEPQKALEHFSGALVLRPDETEIQTLRSKTDLFLASADATRETDRKALGVAHLDYANKLSGEGAACSALEQLMAAMKLLPDTSFDEQLDSLKAACDQESQARVAQDLLRQLEGSIIYSTQVGNSYRVYRQALEPDATPELLVEDAAQPRLSPNGQRLAFFNRREDAWGLNGFDLNVGLLPNDRSVVFTVSRNDARDSPPSWRVDGAQLVFASIRESDGRSRIYVKDAATGDNATSLALGMDPAWHPSADNIIVYSGRDQSGREPGLWMIDDSGEVIGQLTGQERDRRPAWSPDGTFIVFMSDGRDANWELYRLDVKTLQVSRLTENPAQDGLPAVSPDGRYVAYVSDQDEVWRLWVAPLAPSEASGAATGTTWPANLDTTAVPLAPIEGSLVSWLEHAIQWVR